MRLWCLSVLVALAGCGSRTGVAPDAGQSTAALGGMVTNSSSLMPPPLQAVILWPEGQMSPNGVSYSASAVGAVGDGFPAQFTIELSAAPPADVLADFASRGLHAIMANIGVIRSGSLSGELVAACDVWGYAAPVLIYMTDAGAWLSEYGSADMTTYSQGYHLFATRSIDAGPCMNPMCVGPTSELYEIPLDTALVIDLRSPDTWCH